MVIRDKAILNAIRGAFRRIVSSSEEVARNLKSDFDFINNLLNEVNLSNKRAFVQAINKIYETDFNFFTPKEKIIKFFSNHYEVIKEFQRKLDILMRAYNKDGINTITYSFPVFCSINISNKSLLKYLCIMGIKYNGTHEKPEDKMDELERQLHEYEKKMATLIQEDYSVENENIDEFRRLYEEYIEYFYDTNEYIGVIDSDIENFCNDMTSYLLKNKEFIAEMKRIEEEEKAKEERHKERLARRDELTPEQIEYQRREKERLEEEERIAKERAALLEEQEKINNQKRTLIVEIAGEKSLELYDYAKISGNSDATQIIKDIDSAIDLLFENADEDGKEELEEECRSLFDILRNILSSEENIEDVPDVYKLYYSTKYFDDPEKCWFIKDLKNIREESLNTISKNIKELKKGFTSRVKSLSGKTGYMETKDDQIRIVFKPVGGNQIVILGVFIKKDDNDFEMYRKLTERSIELSTPEYSAMVEAFFEKYVEENARRGSRK